MASTPKAEKNITGKPTTERKPADKRVKAKAAEAAIPVAVEAIPLGSAPAHEAAPKKTIKMGKLPPKNKHRLPRRLKKAQQKATGRL
jgi:hypothetical protein